MTEIMAAYWCFFRLNVLLALPHLTLFRPAGGLYCLAAGVLKPFKK